MILAYLISFLVQFTIAQYCDLSGVWVYENNSTMRINFLKKSAQDYRIVCLSQEGCPIPTDWMGIGGSTTNNDLVNFTDALATFDTLSPYEIVVSFYNKGKFINAESAIVSTNCDIFMWQFYLVYVYPQVRPSWCGPKNPSCLYDPSKFWGGGSVHLMEISHSDIGWLGFQNDLEIDSDYITMALDLIRQSPGFQWQSECILFLRAWLNFFPDREWEIIQRMKEGSFDIGGTFTEGFESTMLGEILVRQMYSGRKWFVDRYPGIDSAVVAWHQDGPLRAIQMPQIYAKAGLRYLKFSRYSDRIFHWASPDGSSLLAFGEVHYCEGARIGGAFTIPETVKRMARWESKFVTNGMPPMYPLTQGCDYAPPTLISPYLLDDWQSKSGSNTTIAYSTVKGFLDKLSKSMDLSKIQTHSGERPNLWIYENTPTHHWMFNNYRDAGRILPMAETFSAFCSILSSSWTNYPEERLSEIWRNLTMNDHGFGHENVPKNSSIPKWVVNEKSPDFWDEVYNQKFQYSKDQSESLLKSALSCIVSRISFESVLQNIKNQGSDYLILFNGLSWNISVQIVQIDGKKDLKNKYKPEDNIVLVSTNGSTFQTQWHQGKMSFLATNLPSFGYTTYQIKKNELTHSLYTQASKDRSDLAQMKKSETFSSSTQAKDRKSFRSNSDQVINKIWDKPYINSFYRITPGRGGIASLFDLESNQEIFDTKHYMAGEWMLLNYSGQGASETREIPHPIKDDKSFQRFGNLSGNPIWRYVSDGDVFAKFETDPVQTLHSLVSLELKAYHNVKRIDLRVWVKKWDGAFGGCNRVVFPLNTRTRKLSYSVPFGVVRVGEDENENTVRDVFNDNPGVNFNSFERGWRLRPREIQDWISSEFNNEFGITISSPVGAWDWIDITKKYSELTPVLAPEMLTHTNSNQGPFLPEIGDHFFDFSIFSNNKGNWNSRLREAVAANNPPFSVLTTSKRIKADSENIKEQTLPLSTSFLSVSDPKNNIWVTAVKKEDGKDKKRLVVRLFDSHGVDSSISMKVNIGSPRNFMSTNIIEHPIKSVNQNSLVVTHWSIETYSLEI